MALDTSGESVWFTLYWWGEVWESYSSSWSLGWCLSLCWEWNWKWKWKSVWVAFPFSRGSSHPGIEPRSPTLQADSLPAEPQGKPKNAGVGSLSLLQQIFPTQESNWGLLHCRRILYQLSYQGSPRNGLGGWLNLWFSVPQPSWASTIPACWYGHPLSLSDTKTHCVSAISCFWFLTGSHSQPPLQSLLLSHHGWSLGVPLFYTKLSTPFGRASETSGDHTYWIHRLISLQVVWNRVQGKISCPWYSLQFTRTFPQWIQMKIIPVRL